MRPGKLEALGFAPDDLLKRNPRLVILRVSGFGQDGPYAQQPGFATIAEALSGFSGILGEPGGPPLLPPIAVTDEVTGARRRLRHHGRPSPCREERRGTGDRRQPPRIDVPDHGTAGFGLRPYGLPAAAPRLGHSLYGAARHLPVRRRRLGGDLEFGRQRRPQGARPDRGFRRQAVRLVPGPERAPRGAGRPDAKLGRGAHVRPT